MQKCKTTTKTKPLDNRSPNIIEFCEIDELSCVLSDTEACLKMQILQLFPEMYLFVEKEPFAGF
jgi:hypothetical protein